MLEAQLIDSRCEQQQPNQIVTPAEQIIVGIVRRVVRSDPNDDAKQYKKRKVENDYKLR